MSIVSNEVSGFHSRMSQLEMRLKESEDERFKLEEKFNQLLRSTKSEQSKQLFRLRENYCQLLERDRLRCDRNDLILRALNRIENRTSMLTAKTDRLRILRHYYESYIDHHCSNWKRSDMKFSNFLEPVNDFNENSPSIRLPSPSISFFSSSPVPLFTSTPSTTRRSSLVVPELDLESPKYKFAYEIGSATFPTRRKLFGDSVELHKGLNNKKKPDSKNFTENIEGVQLTPTVKSKDFSKGGKLLSPLSPITTDFEQSTENDLLQLSLARDEPNDLSKNKKSNSSMVETMKPKTNYLSNLHSPNTEYKQSSSILGEKKLAKPSPRTQSKPLTKSYSFNSASSYLNKPDRNFSTERRSNLIRRPTFSYRSSISPQSTERSLSSEARVSSSAAYNRSKSPLKVVDDIFKKYLINYDKRYLSDPISESKYGKYLYPSRNYELEDKKFTSIREESPQHLLDSNYNDFKCIHDENEFYPSSKESVYSNQYGFYRGYEPDHRSSSRSIYSDLDLDSPKKTHSNDWKDWDHYRNRYEYSRDDDVKDFQTISSQAQSANYPKYVNRTSCEDQNFLPQIYVDSSNINHLDGIEPRYKPVDYRRSKYPASKIDQDQHLSDKWYSNDNYSSLGAETLNSIEQRSKAKDNTKMPQTPKKVSFSNEFLYDDRIDLEGDLFVDEKISQDTEDIHRNSEYNDNFTQPNGSNRNSNTFLVHDHKNDITNGNLASYQNGSKNVSLEDTTNLTTSRIGEQNLNSPNYDNSSLVESDIDLLKETNSSINNKLAENKILKETVAVTAKTEDPVDQNVIEFSKEGSKSVGSLDIPQVEDNKAKSNAKDEKYQSQDDSKDSKLTVLQEKEADGTSNIFNEDAIQNEDFSCKEQLFKQNSEVKDNQDNVSVGNDESPIVKNSLSQEYQIESSPTNEISDFVKDDSIHQSYTDVDSQQELKHYEGNKTENANLQDLSGMEQNVLYDTKQETLQDNDYVDQSYQDEVAYGGTNVSQYSSNYEQVNYDSSQPQYEQQSTRGYSDENYTEQTIPEYDQVQNAYETETYAQENVSQSYQELPEAYDNQYPDRAFEQNVNYDTESYRQDYEQPVGEQYHSTGYQQDQYVKDYEGKDEHFSPSHYQSEPGREYAAEQYQEEYPQQPVHYEKDYPVEESNQQFETNYDPNYQKDPQYVYDNPDAAFDPTIPPEQYDQHSYDHYEQQPQQLNQFEQQPQIYDQYDQQPKDYDGYQQPQQYDQQPKDYNEYEQPQHYDQQPKAYDEYEQPQNYDQQPKEYNEYEQQPQQYDQHLEGYDAYEQQPQQYIPYEQEQHQQPHDQYNQGDLGNYEHQQNEQYQSQYQGEPDQFGNYDYSYDGQHVNKDQVYGGDEQLAYSDQPQTYDNRQHPETAQQPYDRSAQLPYGENIHSSYERLQQTYSESQVKYGDEKRSYEDLNQDLGRSYQEPISQTSTVPQPLNKPGKTIQESAYDSSAERGYSGTADNKAAPNLSRVLESDSESARTQDPQETHETSSDFDFSSGPK